MIISEIKIYKAKYSNIISNSVSDLDSLKLKYIFLIIEPKLANLQLIKFLSDVRLV